MTGPNRLASEIAALVLGLAGFALTLAGGGFPGAGLLANGLLLVGLAGLIARVGSWTSSSPGPGFVVALAPTLGLPIVLQRLAQTGLRLVPLATFRGLALQAITLAVGTIAWGLLHAWTDLDEGTIDATIGSSALLALVGLLGLFIARAGARSGPLVLVSLALLGLVIGVLVQHRVASRLSDDRYARLATPAPLVASAVQLLDGFVSWLAVSDVFGLVGSGFSEQVFVSRWLIETTGPGFVVAKWLLALVFAYFAESEVHHRRGVVYVGSYLFVVFLGLGPGLFSLTALFL